MNCFPEKDAHGEKWNVRSILDYLIGYCHGYPNEEAIQEAQALLEDLIQGAPRA